MYRRSVLQGLAASVLVTVSGCTSGILRSGEDVRLERVRVENATDESDWIDVLVEHDGEIVHWEEYDLSPGAVVVLAPERADDLPDDATVETTLPDETGAVVLQYRTADREETVDLAADAPGDCATVELLKSPELGWTAGLDTCGDD